MEKTIMIIILITLLSGAVFASSQEFEIENSQYFLSGSTMTVLLKTKNDFGDHEFEMILYSDETDTVLKKITSRYLSKNENNINFKLKLTGLEHGTYYMLFNVIYDKKNIISETKLMEIEITDENSPYPAQFQMENEISYENENLTLNIESYPENSQITIKNAKNTLEAKENNGKININYSQITGKKLEILHLTHQNPDNSYLIYNIADSLEIDFEKMRKTHIKKADFNKIEGLDTLGYYKNISFNLHINSYENETYIISTDLYNEINEFVLKYSQNHNIKKGNNIIPIIINASAIYESEKDGRYNLRNIKLYDKNKNLINVYDNSSYSNDAGYFEFHNLDQLLEKPEKQPENESKTKTKEKTSQKNHKTTEKGYNKITDDENLKMPDENINNQKEKNHIKNHPTEKQKIPENDANSNNKSEKIETIKQEKEKLNPIKIVGSAAITFAIIVTIMVFAPK